MSRDAKYIWRNKMHIDLSKGSNNSSSMHLTIIRNRKLKYMDVFLWESKCNHFLSTSPARLNTHPNSLFRNLRENVALRISILRKLKLFKNLTPILEIGDYEKGKWRQSNKNQWSNQGKGFYYLMFTSKGFIGLYHKKW